jgi:hypothetical protein
MLYTHKRLSDQLLLDGGGVEELGSTKVQALFLANLAKP